MITINGQNNPWKFELMDGTAHMLTFSTPGRRESFAVNFGNNPKPLMSDLTRFDYEDVERVIDKIKTLASPLTEAQLDQIVRERLPYIKNPEVRSHYERERTLSQLTAEFQDIEQHLGPTQIEQTRARYKKALALAKKMDFSDLIREYSQLDKKLAPTAAELTAKLKNNQFVCSDPGKRQEFLRKECLGKFDTLAKSDRKELNEFIKTYFEVVCNKDRHVFSRHINPLFRSAIEEQNFDTARYIITLGYDWSNNGFDKILRFGDEDLILFALEHGARAQPDHLSRFVPMYRSSNNPKMLAIAARLMDNSNMPIDQLLIASIDGSEMFYDGIQELVFQKAFPQHRSVPTAFTCPLFSHMQAKEFRDELISEKNFSHKALFEETCLSDAWQKYGKTEDAAYDNIFRLIEQDKTSIYMLESDKPKFLPIIAHLMTRPLGRKFILSLVESKKPIVLLTTQDRDTPGMTVSSPSCITILLNVDQHPKVDCISNDRIVPEELPIHITFAHELLHSLLLILSEDLANNLVRTRSKNSFNVNLNEQFAVIGENAIRAEFGEHRRAYYVPRRIL